MKSAKNIVLIIIVAFMQNAWSYSKIDGLFNIPAGEKKLIFHKNPHIEWRQFCFDTKMGCARFKHSVGKSEPIFGYIKVVTDQLPVKDFKGYCKEVFDISYSNDKTLNSFNFNLNSKMPHCSWMGKKDVTHFFWKNGITVVVNTNDQLDVEKILNEAKLNEKL